MAIPLQSLPMVDSEWLSSSDPTYFEANAEKTSHHFINRKNIRTYSFLSRTLFFCNCDAKYF